MLKHGWCLQSGVEKKNLIFKSCGGEPHSEYWGNPWLRPELLIVRHRFLRSKSCWDSSSICCLSGLLFRREPFSDVVYRDRLAGSLDPLAFIDSSPRREQSGSMSPEKLSETSRPVHPREATYRLVDPTVKLRLSFPELETTTLNAVGIPCQVSRRETLRESPSE